MHESLLRDFFLGTADIAALRADLRNTVTQTSLDVHQHVIVDMDTEFEVTNAHLVSLCDAVLADLSIVAFCLVTSDRFEWNTDSPAGILIGKTLYEWDSPEINDPLNDQTVATFRQRLLSPANS